MKKLLMMLLMIGMLIGAGGCGSSIAGSTLLKVAVITGMTSTTAAMTFDKQLYEILKDCDWFMIDPEQYMPESYIKIKEKF